MRLLKNFVKVGVFCFVCLGSTMGYAGPVVCCWSQYWGDGPPIGGFRWLDTSQYPQGCPVVSNNTPNRGPPGGYCASGWYNG